MMERQSIKDQNQQDRQNWELILILKQTILEQENKISELEQSIKKWERKYKQNLYLNDSSPQRQKNNSQDLSFANFIRQFTLLRNKYERQTSKTAIHESTVEITSNQVLQIFERLYKQIAIYQKQKLQKINLIETQTKTIESLKNRLESFRESFEIALKKSESYQDELLQEIKRLQNQIKLLKK